MRKFSRSVAVGVALAALAELSTLRAGVFAVAKRDRLARDVMAAAMCERMVADGNTDGAAQVKARAMARVGLLLEQMDAQLASHGQPWLLGPSYSAVDPLAWMLTRWTRNFTERPARDFAHIAAYQQRVLARPAVQAAIAAEGLQAPHA